ncbi:DUF2332 domain-containing protein [Pseudaestuariivita rosea]|uniref:DUF2332 domain-containing protein n=1 Tax=Pseudaestuariivita rosea TaxID=2763263 RepID=UPI001ABB308A|nr:DUF2332 family protein [Pseudaestuariivita rosea]
MTLKKAFLSQSKSCGKLGSPFMQRLFAICADRMQPGTPLTDRMFNWPGDVSSAGDSVPLRLAGGLHALVLQGDARLGQVYPPNGVSDDQLWDTVAASMTRHHDFLDDWINSPPQTNEVRRSVALIAAGHVIHSFYQLPFIVSELGASAGLNLMWDQYAMQVGQQIIGADGPALTFEPDWSGLVPSVAHPKVVERRGVDLNPIDARSAAGQLRLRAYLWPDQPERRALTDKAISIFDAAIDQGDAIDWLETRLTPRAGHLHIIYHTIAWQYFPGKVQERGNKLIEAAGAVATPDAPLALVSMEADGTPKSAALTLRLWPGDLRFNLARVDFHGRWVNWTYDG